MKRPRYHPSRCKVCGRGVAEGVHVSATGLCPDCGLDRAAENHLAMLTKRGPYAHWWAYRLAAAVGLAPLDDPPPRP